MDTRLHVAFLAAVLACVACRADTVCLSDGTEVDGTIVEEDNATVVIKRPSGVVQSFRKADVDVVVYDKKAAPAKTAAKPASEPVPKKLGAEVKNVDPMAKTAEPVQPAKPPDNSANPSQPAQPTAARQGEAQTAAIEAAAAKQNATKPKAAEIAGAKQDDTKPKAAEVAAPKQDDTRPKAAEPAAAKQDAAKPKAAETAAAKDGSVAKPAAGAAEPGAKKDESKSADAAAGKDEKGKEKEPWTAPPGLAGFPNEAKRMPKEKEEAFMAALARLDTMDEGARQAAEAEISALGGAAMPYLAAGCYHTSVTARSSCMSLIGRLNGRNAIKHVIEVFYSALPADGEPATYQGPFLDAIRTTLKNISGQDFFSADPRRPIVQEFIKRYIAWYNDNFDRLPPQLGEPEVEATDPDYMKKMKEARALKLEKKSWPRPPMSADMVDGAKPGTSRTKPTAEQMVRPADKSKAALPTVGRDEVGKRW